MKYCSKHTTKMFRINTADITVWEDQCIIVAGMTNMLHVFHGSEFTILHDHMNMRPCLSKIGVEIADSGPEADAIKVCRELHCLIMEHGNA